MLASTLDDLGDLPARSIATNATSRRTAWRLTSLASSTRSCWRDSVVRAEANVAAEAVLASDLLPDFKASFVLSMGRAFEQGLDDADALDWYVRAETYSGADAGSALARAGGVRKRLGDAGWIDDYTLAITSYPSSGSAPDLLDELDAAAIPVSDYVRGVVDYRAYRNDAARSGADLRACGR